MLLAAPGIAILQGYASGSLSYGEFIRWSGDISVWLLIATLMVSPCGALCEAGSIFSWQRRRDLGVATYVYSAGHLTAYVLRKADAALIWREGVEAGLLTGWIAFAVFLSAREHQ